MSYMTLFLHKKKHYFRKEFLDDTFFYSVRTFARIRQHYFSKYLGGTDAWTVPPPQILGGPSLPIPPTSPPLLIHTYVLTGRFVLVRGGSCPGGFCLEGFVRGGFCTAPLLSEYIRYNRKIHVDITFNFRFHIYEKKIGR